MFSYDKILEFTVHWSSLDSLWHCRTFLFIIFFSCFLALVDWSRFLDNPAAGLDVMCFGSTTRSCSPSWFVILYFAIFCAIWLVQFANFVVEVKDAVQMWKFFSRKLRLSEVQMLVIYIFADDISEWYAYYQMVWSGSEDRGSSRHRETVHYQR